MSNETPVSPEVQAEADAPVASGAAPSIDPIPDEAVEALIDPMDALKDSAEALRTGTAVHEDLVLLAHWAANQLSA